MTTYRVISFADIYGGMWLVVRLEDVRIIKTFDPNAIWEALAWVKHWGQTENALAKPGRIMTEEATRRFIANERRRR